MGGIRGWRKGGHLTYKREHAQAREAGDRRKMQSVGRKMKATLRDGKTWTNLVAAERALGAK
jgi:hypothetical protein